MQSDVNTWFTDFMNNANTVESDLSTAMGMITGDFTADIDTTLKGALNALNEDIQQLVAAKKEDEKALAEAQSD